MKRIWRTAQIFWTGLDETAAVNVTIGLGYFLSYFLGFLWNYVYLTEATRIPMFGNFGFFLFSLIALPFIGLLILVVLGFLTAVTAGLIYGAAFLKEKISEAWELSDKE